MPPCLSEPQSQLHFFKIMIVFISLFCIHFQLMLPEKMLETKYLYLTEVELGRDSNVSNALSRGNDNETFQLYCNCTCMPTAFIFTVDIHLGALPFPLFRVCMWCSRSVFTFKQRYERKHVICVAAPPSTVRLATNSGLLTRRTPGSTSPYPLRPGGSRAHLSAVALYSHPNSYAPCHLPYF